MRRMPPRDQKDFLKESVNGLAEEGKVISVRLALFAEMMKGKPWTPATLKEVGGTKGVGVTFLEETFSASTAPPEHRLHQKAAQAVLKALLPETGTDIKGQMRSRQELLEASGYANRPRDFDDLIHILDPELRLITPTDPEGSSSEESADHTERAILPTHPRLPGPLPAGLADPQATGNPARSCGTAAGGTVGVWNAKPENRHLPSALGWANIRLLTKKQDWTEPQRRMMKRAGRVHGSKDAWLSYCGVFLDHVGRRSRAMRTAAEPSALVESALKADTRPDVPDIVGNR